MLKLVKKQYHKILKFLHWWAIYMFPGIMVLYAVSLVDESDFASRASMMVFLAYLLTGYYIVEKKFPKDLLWATLATAIPLIQLPFILVASADYGPTRDWIIIWGVVTSVGTYFAVAATMLRPLKRRAKQSTLQFGLGNILYLGLGSLILLWPPIFIAQISYQHFQQTEVVGSEIAPIIFIGLILVTAIGAYFALRKARKS